MKINIKKVTVLLVGVICFLTPFVTTAHACASVYGETKVPDCLLED